MSDQEPVVTVTWTPITPRYGQREAFIELLFGGPSPVPEFAAAAQSFRDWQAEQDKTARRRGAKPEPVQWTRPEPPPVRFQRPDAIYCPYCGQPPGAYCVTASGATATDLFHQARRGVT